MKIREKIYFKISAMLDIIFAKSFTLKSTDSLGLNQEVKYNVEKESLARCRQLRYPTRAMAERINKDSDDMVSL